MFILTQYGGSSEFVHELITEQLDSVEDPPLNEELQQARRARLESRWHEAARAMNLQQRQMQDAVAAVTMAAQAAAQAVASLAGQMARPAAPVSAEGLTELVVVVLHSRLLYKRLLLHQLRHR